jgi:hypothetical protein
MGTFCPVTRRSEGGKIHWTVKGPEEARVGSGKKAAWIYGDNPIRKYRQTIVRVKSEIPNGINWLFQLATSKPTPPLGVKSKPVL